MSAMLKAENIVKSFGGATVLRGVSAEVNKGEVVAIIGRSGSGKSTFLRCLNHLERVDSGRIIVDGDEMVATGADGRAVYAPDKQLRKICLKMGMVFQSYNLFPHFSVLRNLTEAQIHVLKRPAAQAKEKAMELLSKVGLADKANCYPYQLSGGQSQRVAIARALTMDPEILCFDEPTSALDPQLTKEVLAVMRELAEERHTMIVVTHEMNFAREVADRVIFMADGEIVEQGDAEAVLGEGRSERMREFMG
jgi:polar amino acid transport system ATP-binding protein